MGSKKLSQIKKEIRSHMARTGFDLPAWCENELRNLKDKPNSGDVKTLELLRDALGKSEKTRRRTRKGRKTKA
jgi:hypothetical protein